MLYADSTNTLANPTVGYPITGTTQFFGYTCYTDASRQAMVNMLGLTLGQINKNATGTTISKAIFGGTAPANPGIDVQANIGVVPAAWAFAITNTFLSKGDAQAAGLWIQDAIKPVYGTITLVAAVPAKPAVKASLPGVTPVVVAQAAVPGVPAVKGLGVKTATAANTAVCGTKVGA